MSSTSIVSGEFGRKPELKASAKVVEALQQSLVDLVDLSLQAKQAHWNIRGEHFRSLHLELDDVTDLARVALDDVAERLVALNHPVDGRAATVAKTSALQSLGEGFYSTDTIYEALEQQLLTVSAGFKERIPALDDEGDHLSSDLLTGYARDLEKQAWFLRAHRA